MKTNRPCNKLDYQHLVAYLITKHINEVVLHLDLLPDMLLHPVFHVSFFELYASNSILDRVVPHHLLLSLMKARKYEVKPILDSKVMKNKLYYFFNWLGYTPMD